MNKINFSVDTALLLTMLVTGVYFGAQVRADLDHAVRALLRVESAMVRADSELDQDVKGIEKRVRTLEGALSHP